MEPERGEQIDRWLDAALKEYSNTEPRSGLEGRVLARVQAERDMPARDAWWRWPMLAAGTTAALAIGVFLVEQFRPVPPVPIARVMTAPTVVKTSSARGSQKVRAGRPHDSRRDAGATNPRREQFPSPAPLTEQEQILARYVDEHYQHAVLVARARADLAKRDSLEDALSNEVRFGNSNSNREKEEIQ